MATAVLVVGRLVYVTMSDTVGPEFYSKTVNRTIRGSAVAKGYLEIVGRAKTKIPNIESAPQKHLH